jgi:hypothetical protein
LEDYAEKLGGVEWAELAGCAVSVPVFVRIEIGEMEDGK